MHKTPLHKTRRKMLSNMSEINLERKNIRTKIIDYYELVDVQHLLPKNYGSLECSNHTTNSTCIQF